MRHAVVGPMEHEGISARPIPAGAEHRTRVVSAAARGGAAVGSGAHPAGRRGSQRPSSGRCGKFVFSEPEAVRRAGVLVLTTSRAGEEEGCRVGTKRAFLEESSVILSRVRVFGEED